MENYHAVAAKNVKDYIGINDLTQGQVAEEIGVDRAYLCSWLNGRRVFPLGKLLTLAGLLHLDFPLLFIPNSYINACKALRAYGRKLG